MRGKDFLNFDLLMEPAEFGYRARVVNSPAGQAAHPFTLPFTANDLTSVFAEFSRTTAPEGSVSASDRSRTFGKQLFDAVFADELKIAFIRSIDRAAGEDKGLRIQLRLKDVPELADLPWELLHDGQDFVFLSTKRALVRFLELPQPVKPLLVNPPLRALVIVSSPGDYAPLDVEREWARLNDALASSPNLGLFETEQLAHASLAELQQALRRNEYHILHFSGHAEFDERADDALKGSLVFESNDGSGQAVDAVALGRLLREHPSLRLVVLNACEGARASTRNAFAGAAQTLIQQGIPAVVAMQFPVTDDAAQVFSRTLYGALADGFSIDAALGETRNAIAVQQAGLEWATPIVFTRAENGVLFELAAKDDVKERELNRAKLARYADAALQRGDFEGTIGYATRLEALDPKDELGRALRERAERARELARLYDVAKQALEAGRWQEALDTLQRLQGLKFNYRVDVPRLIDRAMRALQAQSGPTVAIPPAAAPSRTDEYESHYKNIVRELLRGRVFPFFGQNVNSFGRSPGAEWQSAQLVPSAEELALYLAHNFDYDLTDTSDLMRVSQYISVMRGGNVELFEELHSLLTKDAKPSPLHRFWAGVPALLRARGIIPERGESPSANQTETYPILFTANYDDLLEQAFRDEDEPFDLLIYLVDGEDHGKFLHRTSEEVEKVVLNGSDYPDMQLDRRTTIIKVYGAMHRRQPERDSYVITEDHYLDYLKENIRDLLPQTINKQIARSYGLFMGCNLRNWNLRGVLYRLGKSNRRPWVIQPRAQEVDLKYWNMLNVELLNLTLEDFLQNLSARLTASAAAVDSPKGGAQ